MLRRISQFLNRPLSGDFSFRAQLTSAARGGAVIFGVLLLFTNPRFVEDRSEWFVVLMWLTGGIILAELVAGYVVPKLIPAFYDENRWTVWKYGLHVPMLLLLISISNQVVLWLTINRYPPFGLMYLNVMAFGIFPVSLDILLTEQRRLRRNLAHARSLNEQLPQRTSIPVSQIEPSSQNTLFSNTPERIALTSENGRDQLRLLPGQLQYVESVGNYVEVHWLNAGALQKTVLRTTLKDVAELLVPYPAFFRCHRAFLVNLTTVTHTEGNARGYQLTLADVNTPIPVSRSYLQAFDSRMNTVL